jgi:DNA-binding helix-hairpin-helix protein with protein kinase domain
MNQIFDIAGQPKNIGSLIASGGEGSVYLLTDKPGILIKVYHNEKLAKNRKEYQDKIDAMISVKNELEKTDVCWPLLSVYNSSKKWVGYAMKQGIGSPMRYLAHGIAYKKHFPNLNRVGILKFLLSFITTIMELHSKNILIGDYNLLNFLCNNTDYKVKMIDCDSYQVTIGNKFFPCPVGSPDLTPIEHHNKDFKKLKRSLESERFSLAIILFECLMLGRHPYDIVGGDDPVTNLRNAHFPYGRGSTGIPIGPWYNIWSHMPYRIKNLFIQNFTEGVNDPGKRSDISIWYQEISTYLSEMNRGWHNKEIIPDQPKSREYRGNKPIETI